MISLFLRQAMGEAEGENLGGLDASETGHGVREVSHFRVYRETQSTLLARSISVSSLTPSLVQFIYQVFRTPRWVSCAYVSINRANLEYIARLWTHKHRLVKRSCLCRFSNALTFRSRKHASMAIFARGNRISIWKRTRLKVAPFRSRISLTSRNNG